MGWEHFVDEELQGSMAAKAALEVEKYIYNQNMLSVELISDSQFYIQFQIE